MNHKTLILLLVALSSSVALDSHAAASDCREHGGKTQCVDFVAKTEDFPKFEFCRTTTYVGNEELWCQVRNGTWNPAVPGCEGELDEVTEYNFANLALAVERQWHQPVCDETINQNNWGSVIEANSCGWNGGSLQKGSKIYEEKRSWIYTAFSPSGGGGCTGFNGSSWYVLKHSREVYCPPGYQEGISAGQPACLKVPAYDDKKPKGDDKPTDPPRDSPKDPPKNADPAEPKPVNDPTCNGGAGGTAGGYSPGGKEGGNPVDFAAGSKESVETDYSSGAEGGLVFVRHYSSASYFSLDAHLENYSDYWRHSYASRVFEYPTNAYVLASVQAPSGVVTSYDLSGLEITNDSPGTTKLLKLESGGVLVGWRQTFGNGDTRDFDAQGRLTSTAERSGFVRTLAYDGSGRLSTISDMYGRSIVLSYDANGRLAAMTDPSSRQTSYGYDPLGRLVSVTRPDSTVRTYLYEDSKWIWLMTGVVDERGIRSATFTYTADGRAASTERTGPDTRYGVSYAETATTATRAVTDPFGNNQTYNFSKVNGVLRMTNHVSLRGTRSATYDANGNILTKTDRRNNVTTFVFDAARRLETSRTEASGSAVARTITTTWHPTFDLPSQITRPSSVAGTNLVTTIGRDTNGNVTSVQETAGALTRQTTYTRNALGQILTIDGPRSDVSDVTTFTYYPSNDTCVGCRGQVATITNAAGHVTTFNSYNLDSSPLTVTDANGIATSYTYNTRGKLATVTRGADTTQYEYDAIGLPNKLTMPDGSWVHYTFDEANALIGIDDSFGNAIDYELDLFGNVVKTDTFDPADQLKRTMQKVYDGANRHVRDVGGLGQETQYQRDGNSNITKITDPLYNVTSISYDALDRFFASQDPFNNFTYFTYDALDNLATVKDPRGLTTTYVMDALGNRKQLVSPDTGTTNYTVNAAGELATRTDSRSVTTTYTRDALGRVTSSAVTDGQVDFEYDNTTTGGAYAKGRLTKITDPSGNTQYQYDSLGRASAKTQVVGTAPNTKTFAIQYGYSLGRLSSMVLPSGRVVSYGFDANGRPSSISVDGSVLLSDALYEPFGDIRKWTWANGQSYERTRDLDGRITSATLGPDTITYADLSQVFGYDNLNRIVSATLAAGQTRGYAYDTNGNRTSATVNATATTYTYLGTSHKLSSLSGGTSRSFTYDNAGSVTASAGFTFVYDGRGRMKQAGATTYLVNGLGQRVKKGAPDVFFAYDEAGHLVGEYDSTGAAIQEYVWLGNTPVAVVKPALPSGYTAYYIWADLLDTPRIITDAANQARWSWMHDEPFGNSAANENPAGLGAFSFNLRFPGQYYDAETQLHYNYFRDYDPRLGRYIESDPIGLRGGMSSFAYVSNSPLRYQDALGLTQQDIDNMLELVKMTQLDLNVPNQVGTYSGGAEGGGITWPVPGRPVSISDSYLRPLNDNELRQLFEVLTHESIHRTRDFSDMILRPRIHPDIYDEAAKRTKDAERYLEPYLRCPSK